MEATTKILIVEDEFIIAKEMERNLKRLGYSVTAMIATGEKAIQKTLETRPDLVLMDIKLKGDMDGIEAAKQIRTQYDIPVIYLTSYSDNQTLQRAKITEPFGYLLKPFEEKNLYTAIEMALYKHKIEREKREIKIWMNSILNNICEGMIATDNNNQIIFMNSVAEALTGWKLKEIFGKPLKEVFKAFEQVVYKTVINPLTKISFSGFDKELYNNILISKDGKNIPIENNYAPLKNDKGIRTGTMFIFRDISECKRVEEKLLKSRANLQNVLDSLRHFLFLIDSNIHIIYVQAAVRECLGYEEKDMRGKKLSRFCSPDEYEKMIALIDKVKEEKNISCPLTLLDKDGDKRYLKTILTVDRWMNKNMVFGISGDISESKFIKKVSRAYCVTEEKHF